MRLGTEVAVIGLAARYPGFDNVHALWAGLMAGRQGVSPLPGGAPGTIRTTRLLKDADRFDAAFFGISPAEALHMDPQHRLFLECCYQALEDGGLARQTTGAAIGVFGGASATLYGHGALAQASGALATTLPYLLGLERDYLASRVAHALGLTGPALTVQTACSTSLVAIHLACRALLAGECDAALAGGVSVTAPRSDTDRFVSGGLLSADGICRSFDAGASGTVFAEGVGAVLLMRLEDALAEGRHIYAVVAGSAMNNDGNRGGVFAAPSVAGQERVLREALSIADVAPSTIGFVEGHGAGTLLGDAVELTALERAYFDGGSTMRLLGSIKSNIGHTAAAAGVAGFIKAALAVRTGKIPATLHFKRPNPDLHSQDFEVNVTSKVWPSASNDPRRAGVSAFGMGGVNCHVILEAAPPQARRPAARSVHVLPLSAIRAEAADRTLSLMSDHIRAQSELDIGGAAYGLSIGRPDLQHRRAAVAYRSLPGGPLSSDVHEWIVPPHGGTATERQVVLVLGYRPAGERRCRYLEEPLVRQHLEACVTAADRCGLDVRRVLLPPDESDAVASTGLDAFAIDYSVVRSMLQLGLAPAGIVAVGHGIAVAEAALGVSALDNVLTRVIDAGGNAIDPSSDWPSLPYRGVTHQIDENELDELIQALSGGKPALAILVGSTADLGPLAPTSPTVALGFDAQIGTGPARSHFMRALASCWVAGADITWSLLYGSQPPAPVPMPPSVFAGERFWLEDVTTAPDVPVQSLNRSIPDASGATPDIVEERISRVWSAALGVASPPRDADFFDLGGTSLIGMQIIAELSLAFGVEISLDDAFTSPTIAGLAKIIEDRIAALVAGLSDDEVLALTREEYA